MSHNLEDGVVLLDGLTKNGTTRPIYLNAYSLGVMLFERMRKMKYGLVEVGVTLLEEVCHWEWSLKYEKEVCLTVYVIRCAPE